MGVSPEEWNLDDDHDDDNSKPIPLATVPPRGAVIEARPPRPNRMLPQNRVRLVMETLSQTSFIRLRLRHSPRSA